MVKFRSDLAFTNDTPYLALTGEIWGVFNEFFSENWPRYIESVLYTSLVQLVTYFCYVNSSIEGRNGALYNTLMDNCCKSCVQVRFLKPNTIVQYIIQVDYDVFAHTNT